MTQTPAANNHPAGVTPASTTPAPAQTQTPTGANTSPVEQTWDSWLAQRPEAERTLINDLYAKKNAGHASALESERQARREMEKQIRDLAKAAEAGSDSQNKLTGLADQLAVAERRADFYEAAAKPDVGIVDVKAAWLIANAESDAYFDKRGNLNVELLKKEHPSLFAQPRPTPKGNAGSGTQNADGGAATSMNDIIRRAAGRQ